MEIERVTTKYTGHRVEADALIAAHRRGGLAQGLAHELERAATALAGADADLIRLATAITDDCGNVRHAVDAGPADPASTLNPLGELQARGPRLDAVIAVRDDRITHLRALVRLWRQLPPDSPTTA